MDYIAEKENFRTALKNFANSLREYIAQNGEWTIKGFIDVFKNVYTISTDTKIVSKVLELHIFPLFLDFAEKNNFILELATCQNWYPDLTFISKDNREIKFAVDLKTTYRSETHNGFCNGFTLGSHGEYFINRESAKNIQYPYCSYVGHFCLGIIYSRALIEKNAEIKKYSIDEIEQMPSVINNFTFFAEEKWRIASDKSGSGNTANIGSIHNIEDILNGNGVFANAGEALFDDYWANFGKLQVPDGKGKFKKLSSFAEFLAYKGLPDSLNNKQAPRRKQ